jgi:hypothetical protein
MADSRYVKTEKGATEISKRRNNLRGRLRTMLILMDASKTVEDLRRQAAQIGAPPDFLEVLERDGYIVSLSRALAHGQPQQPVAVDEFSRFRIAKSFMNETIVDTLGIRAFTFTLRLERCSMRADLVPLIPDYAKALRKSLDESETRVLVDRALELLA